MRAEILEIRDSILESLKVQFRTRGIELRDALCTIDQEKRAKLVDAILLDTANNVAQGLLEFVDDPDA